VRFRRPKQVENPHSRNAPVLVGFFSWERVYSFFLLRVWAVGAHQPGVRNMYGLFAIIAPFSARFKGIEPFSCTRTLLEHVTPFPFVQLS